MKKVLIAEKPSMIKKYKSALGSDRELIIVSSIGHIEELLPPESYLDRDKRKKIYWDELLGHFPFVPKNFKHGITNPGQFKKITDALKGADEIILACDPDREGELIHRNILKIAKEKGLVKTNKITRVWLHSETKQEIQKAYRNRKPYLEYDGYYKAANIRAVIDWLVGIQFTVLYSVRFAKKGKPLSIGRVQTWLLSEIVKRSLQFENFVPENFWSFTFLTASGVMFSLVDKKRKRMPIFNEQAAEELFSLMNGESIKIDAVKKRPFKEYAPSLYDLKQLQKDASSRYGIAPESTLKTADGI